MAWVMPTATQVKAAVAALASVDDAAFDGALELALGDVSKALPSQAIYTQAAILYVAHEMTLWGYGTGPEAELAQSGTLSSVSDGTVSFTRKVTTNSSAMDLTTFGVRYRELVKRYAMPFTVCSGDHT